MEDGSKKYFSKKGRMIFICALFVLFFSGIGLYYLVFVPDWRLPGFLNLKKEKAVISDDSVKTQDLSLGGECSACFQRRLDGVYVASQKSAESFPVAVVIDNDIMARPQESLSKASLVYEVPVEGGMTRYLAIFPADIDLSAVGPVRSARPYLVALAEELKALFVHCGGSQEALNLIKEADLYDLNEFYNANYFWRDRSSVRLAPHNVLISGDNWRSYLEKRGLSDNKAEAWLFKEEAKLDPAPEAQDINIYFSANFRAMWRYQPDTNSYRRFFNGLESADGFGPIQAKNVIIQFTDTKVLDEAGRLQLDLSGSGEAKICVDGICRQGVWRQRDGRRTRYYYEDGEEIKLNPGVTWIEIAGSNTRVE